jgi:hypothetical protein
VATFQTQQEDARYTGISKAFTHEDDGTAFGFGRVVPADSETGWSHGCLFVHTDGSGAADAVYYNIGTTLSCNFDELNATLLASLAATTAGNGAALVGVEDSGSLLTAATVEAALAELAQHNKSAQNFIALPLHGWREATNFDVGAIAVNGGILASDTTPIMEAVNAASDGCQRITWAAANSDQIICQTPIPPDLDDSSDVVVHLRAAMAGGTDTPKFTLDSFFNEGDTKITDLSPSISGMGYTEYIITIAAADIPEEPQTLTLGLTLAAHTTDALYLTATWLEYTAAHLTS